MNLPIINALSSLEMWGDLTMVSRLMLLKSLYHVCNSGINWMKNRNLIMNNCTGYLNCAACQKTKNLLKTRNGQNFLIRLHHISNNKVLSHSLHQLWVRTTLSFWNWCLKLILSSAQQFTTLSTTRSLRIWFQIHGLRSWNVFVLCWTGRPNCWTATTPMTKRRILTMNWTTCFGKSTKRALIWSKVTGICIKTGINTKVILKELM